MMRGPVGGLAFAGMAALGHQTWMVWVIIGATVGPSLVESATGLLILHMTEAKDRPAVVADVARIVTTRWGSGCHYWAKRAGAGSAEHGVPKDIPPARPRGCAAG
jgi:hypothetical protein